MNIFQREDTINRMTLQEFDYVNLDQEETQLLIKSVARLMDEVFETPDRDFQEYVREEQAAFEVDPMYEFNRLFDSVEHADMTKYQRNFFNLIRVNINTTFKWYKKNGSRINMSPKQAEWFDRWFEKHDVGHETLRSKLPNYTRVVIPNIRRGR